MKFLKMLLVLIAVVLFLLPLPAAAASWHTANEVTVKWDAVSVPPGDAISYNVYLKNAITGAETFNGEETSTSVLLTFITEGQFYPGVSALRKVDVNKDGVWNSADLDVDGNPVIMESTITWSNSTDPVAVPDPFGLRWFVAPVNPKAFSAELN